MLGKRSKLVIGKLTGSLVSGNRQVHIDMTSTTTSPRTPLEFKIQSPRGPKSYDLGGVGLGILAALENSGETHIGKAFRGRNSNRSDPIPVNSGKNSSRVVEETVDSDSLEDYTFVTRHRPEMSCTRVYRDGREDLTARNDVVRVETDRRNRDSCRKSVFKISPARFGDFPALPSPDFLNSCHLCQKKLHGKDIYMYRGEKAFCSTECRYRQIVMDERKENCSSEASRSADISSSPYTNGQMFSTGILAI